MIQKPKRLKTGINITVSPAAHKKMKKEGRKGGARRNLRQYVNFINKLAIDL